MAKTRTKPAPPSNGTAPPPLRLEWRSPAELAENPQNWRRHPEAQISALTDVLAEVGWAGACLLNARTNRLIDGHARRKVALEQGTAKVPVLIGDWSEEQERTILASLDPIGAMATADKDALDALLREVHTGSEALGTMLTELAQSNGIVAGLGGNGQVPDDPGPQTDRAAELQEKWQTATGQFWEIPSKATVGRCHRLLCGDSTKAEDVASLMDGKNAMLMNTDPPYGVAYSDSARVAAERAAGRRPRDRKWEDNAIDNDEVDGEKLQVFLEACIRAAVPHLTDNVAFYLWHPMLTQGTFFAAAAAADILIHRQIIWVKPGLLFGFGDYHWQHELCFYGWRRGHRPEFYGERNQTTVWALGHEQGASAGERNHPTQKPVELFARPIHNHTKPHDVVYEPFAGSASQFVAAEQTGRLCYGIEIHPPYVAVCLERLAGLNLTPRLAS